MLIFPNVIRGFSAAEGAISPLGAKQVFPLRVEVPAQDRLGFLQDLSSLEPKKGRKGGVTCAS